MEEEQKDHETEQLQVRRDHGRGRGGGRHSPSLSRARNKDFIFICHLAGAYLGGAKGGTHPPPPYTYLAPPPLGLIAHMRIILFRPLFFPKIPVLPPLKHNPRYATVWCFHGLASSFIFHINVLAKGDILGGKNGQKMTSSYFNVRSPAPPPLGFHLLGIDSSHTKYELVS